MPALSRVLLAVALGGAVGSVLRWGAGEAVPDGDGYALTTLAVNVLGTALLAGLLVLPLARRSPLWAAGLGPGLLGGFTTFSTTSEQARQLLADDRPLVAVSQLAVTLACCLLVATLVGRHAPALPDEDER